MLHDPALCKQVQHLGRGRGHQRVAAVGGSVIPGHHGRGGRTAGQKRAHGHAVSQGLGYGHHVRLDPVALPGEHVAGPSHAALDLIQNHQQAVLVAQGAHAL